MRIALFSCTLSLALTACGSSDAPTHQSADDGGSGGLAAAVDEYPPPPEGYTRIDVPTMHDLPPGSDTMYCQYVYGPVDHDIDILHLSGYQSEGGHHVVAYATDLEKPIGTSGPCTADESLVGAFLGSVGGESGGSAADLPEGVGFRMRAGQSIMLNTHFLNTTNESIDGKSALDIEFAEVDPSRKIASLFPIINMSFEVAPQSEGTAIAECTLPQDMKMISFANHMHDFGTHVWTDLVRAGSTEPEMVKEDPDWSYEMQFNLPLRSWSLEAPFELHAGDTLQTHCNWSNTSDDALAFPREMCVGVVYFLTEDGTSPTCIDGAYAELQ